MLTQWSSQLRDLPKAFAIFARATTPTLSLLHRLWKIQQYIIGTQAGKQMKIPITRLQV
jgi:hypothetical protein